MSDEIALGYLGSPMEPSWFFFRSTGEHSGNNDSLSKAFQRFLVEGQKYRKGYYGERLDNSKLVAGKSLIKWSEE
jgi:hypothetical protein